MTNDFIFDNLKQLLVENALHRLIVCSELKISLATLDDFIEKRQRPTPEMFQKLNELLLNNDL